MNLRNNIGVTLIALITTVIILIILAGIVVTFNGEDKEIASAKKTEFASRVTQYRDAVTKYYARQIAIDGDDNIDTTDPSKISTIIQDINGDDIEKFVIEDNELKYKADKVTDEERKTLEYVGISKANNI